ncbi:hypothetical protein LH51_03865 [Nitrincola sp. A-D6]|uniref:hypothetical protein n=1 Tax=Nitrincola sp. A-D6 TaxID=1545442 RepID=UPI00051FA95D|nr:hypothetical protein [Nitrincola sp. A-D6]KGK42881.1 hypothetical protein LH51_03865 [Nitrincola sp. A-D6]
MSTAASTPKPINHDLPTLLRLCAITLIVSGHFGLFEYGGGGAALLMVIVGYNIATFKLSKVLKTDSIMPVAMMIIKVMIPTIAYVLFIQLYYGSFRLVDVLLVANFVEARHPMGFSYWFIEVYIQIQLILLLLLALPQVRALLNKNRKLTSYAFVAIAVLTFIVCDAIWDTHHLYRRLPWLMMWLIAFGFAARFTETLTEKSALTTAFIISAYIFYGEVNLFLSISVALLIFNPPLRLPRLTSKGLNFLAAGSLFIYLTHFQTRAVLEKLIFDSPLLYTLLAILIGATIFNIYNKIINKKILEAIILDDKATSQSTQANEKNSIR